MKVTLNLIILICLAVAFKYMLQGIDELSHAGESGGVTLLVIITILTIGIAGITTMELIRLLIDEYKKPKEKATH